MRELINNINPQRIKWCCDEVGCTLSDLSVQLKIPEVKLQEGTLTYRQLKKIGDHFGYGALFFLESELPKTEKIHSLAFRTLANQRIAFDHKLKKLVEQVERHRDIYLAMMEETDKKYHAELPKLTGSIQDKATAVRHWLNIEYQAKYNFDKYRALIEAKGILVFRSMGYKGRWKVSNSDVVGFCVAHDIVPVIFITKTSPERQTFTLFHELGHLLLHEASCIDNEDNLSSSEYSRRGGNKYSKREREANQFAGLCLVPPEFIPTRDELEGLSAADYQSTFSPIAKQLGVSVEVIVVRLLQKKMILSSEYADYKNIMAQRSEADMAQSDQKQRFAPRIRYREPKHIFGEPYVRAVLGALQAESITLNKASDFLDRLQIKDINKLSQEHYGQPD